MTEPFQISEERLRQLESFDAFKAAILPLGDDELKGLRDVLLKEATLRYHQGDLIGYVLHARGEAKLKAKWEREVEANEEEI